VFENVNGVIIFQSFQCPTFTELNKLLPSNCLCSPNDEIPGLLTRYLPSELHSLTSAKKRKELLVETTKVYVNNCTVRIPNMLEIRLREALKTAYGKYAEITIAERYISIASHNQWCFTNISKLKNSLTLIPENNKLKCNGSLIVDSVYVTEGIALVFILEYKARISRKGVEDECKEITLAELVYVLKGKHNTRRIKVEMNTDSGLCISGKSLWIPSVLHNWEIVLECEIAFSEITKNEPSKKIDQETAISHDLSLVKNVVSVNKISIIEKPVHKLNEPVEEAIKESKLKPKVKEEAVSIALLTKAEEAQTNEVYKSFGNMNVKYHMSYDFENVQPEFKVIHEIDPNLNSLKASSFLFSFISFTVNEDPEIAIPKGVCFSFKFFNFPITYTQSAILKGTKGNKNYGLEAGPAIGKWSNTISKEKGIVVEFNVDPSVDTEIAQEMQAVELMNYLTYNELLIWVWNINGPTPIGYIKIPLAKLIRSDSPTAQLKKDFKIMGENMGMIQMRIENIGQNLGEVKKHTYTRSKLKKSSAFNKSQYDFQLHMSIAAAKRGIPFWSKESKENDIGNFRSLSRSVDISKTLRKLEVYPTVNYSLGQMTLFPILIANTSEMDNVFSLHIEDAEGSVSVVKEPEQWKFFCSQEGYEAPFNWNILHNLKSIPLKSHQHLMLIMKLHPLTPPKMEERAITITMANDKEIVMKRDIILKYKDTYYNQYSILNAPENITIDVSFIADLPENMYRYARAIKCSNTRNVDCKLISSRILANYSTPSSPTNTDLLFYLYSDEYCYRLLAIIYVEVRAYTCLNLGGIASKRIETSVEFVNKKEMTQVEFQTNNENRLEIDLHYIHPLDSVFESKISVPITVKSSKVGKSTVLLHCIGKDRSKYRL